ncbi:hypothetical protein GobsT_05860 [Gemmata obscuriglobus]|uniref:Uncharacterized protein n=1 Tax=Gemmata obscuriglobus TaxID=114 RepID=A0A2Z3H256_9BACT|nr:hypothetical protein [Gemmata obscuriglobus]AWM40859.1 hypothetical protein C1280_30295 [Gemmata obscuriglobus]QEG25851.1 hypothetical protein GobsT_05860 [Gemmata obscuriglobus]VTR99832.1 unnamed protein product [Gemmata obscuriglobus UQM 2246]
MCALPTLALVTLFELVGASPQQPPQQLGADIRSRLLDSHRQLLASTEKTRKALERRADAGWSRQIARYRGYEAELKRQIAALEEGQLPTDAPPAAGPVPARPKPPVCD